MFEPRPKNSPRSCGPVRTFRRSRTPAEARSAATGGGACDRHRDRLDLSISRIPVAIAPASASSRRNWRRLTISKALPTTSE